MVIEARRQAVADPATDTAHVVIGILPTATITVAQAVTIIVVVGVLAPDPDLLTVIDTTALGTGPDVMMMTEFETEAHVASALVVESERQAQSASHLHLSQPRTNETGGPSSCSSLLLG